MARLKRWQGLLKGEAVPTRAAALSSVVLRLNQASLHLNQLNHAIREVNSAAAEEALNGYLREFSHFRMQLDPLPIGRQDHGVISAVLDQLESQLSRLEQMKTSVVAGYAASVEQPLNEVKLALRMVQDKVIKGAR